MTQPPTRATRLIRLVRLVRLVRLRQVRAGRVGERGAATAELAMVLPMLVAVTIALVWLLSLGTAQVRAVDAARETARALARGDAQSEAVARGRRVAPPGSTVTVAVGADEVTVLVSGRVSGPGGLLRGLPSPRVQATAVAAVEGPP